MRSTSIQETTPAPLGNGVEQGQRRHSVCRELVPALKPNQPNHSSAGAQRDEGHVVRTVAHGPKPLRLPMMRQRMSAGQAGADVHDVAAREVEGADGVADERALAAPDHVGQRWVDKHGPTPPRMLHRAELMRPATPP